MVQPDEGPELDAHQEFGNAFLASIVAEAGLSSGDADKLAQVASTPSTLDALFSIVRQSPSPDQLDAMAAVDEAGLKPDEVNELGDEATAGGDSGGAADGGDIPAGGSPLPHLDLMQQAFGEDLSDVRANLSQQGPLASMRAHAATDGESASFASSAPSAEDVAHEVAHIVQKRRNGATSEVANSPGQPGEREAESVAARAAAGQRVDVRQPQPGRVSRKAWYSHVGDFFSGVGGGIADTVTGIADMGVGAWNLTGGWLFDPDQSKKTASNLWNTVTTVVTDPKVLLDAVTDPIVKEWNDGRPGAAIGRAVFEIAGLLVGTKGLDKLSKGSKVAKVTDALSDAGKLNKVDDVGRVGGKLDDVGKVGDKVDDVGKVGDKLDDVGRTRKPRKDPLTDDIPEHTSHRHGSQLTKKELAEIKQKYKIDSDSEARAIHNVELQNSTKEIVAGENAIKRSLGIDPNKPGVKMTDMMKTDKAGNKVPIEVKNQKEIHLSGKGNSALGKFEDIAKHGDMEGITHFEVMANLDSKLPPNFKVDQSGNLHRLVSGTDKWEKVEIGGKGVKITRTDLGPISE